MNSIASPAESQASVAAAFSHPRRKEASLPKVQNAQELLSLDFCEISGEAGEYKGTTFERWQGSKAGGDQGRYDTSAAELKDGIMDYLKNSGAMLGTGEDSTWSATTANGTTVDVSTSQITLPSGKMITLPNGISSNMRITELEDGGIVVVTGDATISYDKDGKEISVEEGKFNPLMGTDGNDFIINMDGEEVGGGAGDDTILNYAQRTTIRGGAGDDTVILAGGYVQNVSVDLGEGDDTVESTTLLRVNEGRLSINGGSGNDEIKLGRTMTRDLTITGGDGDDNISVQQIYSADEGTSIINGGNGDDQIFVGGVFKGVIDGGSGDDSISADTVWGGSILGGSGSNTIHVNRDVNNALGAGNVEGMYRSLLYAGGEAHATAGQHVVGRGWPCHIVEFAKCL